MSKDWDGISKRVTEVWNNAVAENKMNDTKKTYRVPVEENEQGDAMITLPDEIIKSLDLKDGDALEWHVRSNGSIVLSKKK